MNRTFIPVLAIVGVLFTCSFASRAADGTDARIVPGQLDPSFGTNGIAITSFLDNAASEAESLVVQTDGRIVFAGSTIAAGRGHFAVTRVLANGRNDATFGSGGTSILALPEFLTTESNAVALQSDGRIVVAGFGKREHQKGTECVLARLLPNGSPDPSFGDGGRVFLDVGTEETDEFESVIVQPDGRIIAAGSSLRGDIGDFCVIARFNSDGSPDLSFASGGTLKFRPSFDITGVSGLDLMSNGMILANIATKDGPFSAARVLPGGSLDPSFGSGGIATIALPFIEARSSDLAVRQDGRVVVAGTAEPFDVDGSDTVVARLTSTGAIDGTFGVGGFTRIGTIRNEGAVDCWFDGTGKVVAAGTAWEDDLAALQVVRLNPDGSLDASFGSSGVSFIPLGGGGAIRTAAPGPGGRFVLGGLSTDSPADVSLLARMSATGSLDPTFGSGGLVSVVVQAPGSDEVSRVVAQADGRLVCLGGTTGTPSEQPRSLIRFNANGSLDSTFGVAGRVRLTFTDVWNARDVVVQPDGKILICGLGPVVNNRYAFRVQRFLPSGVRDVRFGTNSIATAFQQAGCCSLPNALAVSPDGKILVVGRGASTSDDDGNGIVARLTSTGLVDKSFARGGFLSIHDGGFESFSEAAVGPNGSVLAAGEFSSEVTGSRYIGIAKILPTGSLDPSFGDGGIARVTLPSEVFRFVSLYLDVAGRPVLAGEVYEVDEEQSDVFVARLTQAGEFDASFGEMGLAIIELNRYDTAAGAVPTSDGRIAFAGTDFSIVNGTRGFFGRLTSAGALDETFGTQGVVYVSVGAESPLVFNDVLVQPGDGKIVAAGLVVTPRDIADVLLVRVLNQ